ncbi:hypothetical protein [Chryseosolibacter indicus]|uniref:Uncharacterized protein n=1 Tax=Chryseosolibacter indicus TaxID=2782351 RepID=A0ABS5VRC8_9BACT|nr:hypothetical protein [Chryseosolibacter indicus]MBT1703896.1 hypothetical protein [Chryseosolibacter indicus]
MPNRRSDTSTVPSRTDNEEEPRRKREHPREEGSVNEHRERVKLRSQKQKDEKLNGSKNN